MCAQTTKTMQDRSCELWLQGSARDDQVLHTLFMQQIVTALPVCIINWKGALNNETTHKRIIN